MPGVEEDSQGALIRFTVAGNGFADVSKDRVVQLRLPKADVDTVLAEHPTAERVAAGPRLPGVRVPLADLNGQQLNHWVRRGWLAAAPEDVAADARASATARVGEVGDLPKAIGSPATRALAGAGLTSLADVRAYGIRRLGELHGVGPKAIGILEQAIGASAD